MTLHSPAALWTLAALALPLAIHLWRRPPRTVRVGSLRFLQSRPRRWQNLRWREYLLLAVRLGLLTLLALLLARPFWRQPPPVHPPRWALIDPAAAPAGLSLERLRALQAAGAEMHLLAPGFPALQTPPADSSASVPDVWSLLREADATLPTGSSLAVFSPGRLASLRGVRPSLVHLRVEWIETPSIFIPPVATATTPPAALTALILHDADRAEDARAVAAALDAIARVDRRPLSVSTAATAPPFARTDWVFWLSAQPVPSGVAANAANVFNDAAAPAADTTPGWIVPQPGTAAPGLPVRLWQRTVPSTGLAVWTDEFGQPLLTRTDETRGTRWHFASRFHPAWNDLPLGTALPVALRALLAGPGTDPTAPTDTRLADPSQFLLADAPAASASALSLPGPEIDGRTPLWALAALLFGLERFLSHRRESPAAVPATVPTAEPALSR